MDKLKFRLFHLNEERIAYSDDDDPALHRNARGLDAMLERGHTVLDEMSAINGIFPTSVIIGGKQEDSAVSDLNNVRAADLYVPSDISYFCRKADERMRVVLLGQKHVDMVGQKHVDVVFQTFDLTEGPHAINNEAPAAEFVMALDERLSNMGYIVLFSGTNRIGIPVSVIIGGPLQERFSKTDFYPLARQFGLSYRSGQAYLKRTLNLSFN